VAPTSCERRLIIESQMGEAIQGTFDRRKCAGIGGELALTSARLPDGSVTAEAARRQGDGTWPWVIDLFSVIGQRMDPAQETHRGIAGG
jgi:hypothetical protein